MGVCVWGGGWSTKLDEEDERFLGISTSASLLLRSTAF